MKYSRLTKEQLEELHPEFINFLATQSIDKKEWDEIKENRPDVALEEIDVFSDIIWERALQNVKYVDHFTEQYIFLFECFEIHLESIVIQIKNTEIDLQTSEGIEWLSENLYKETVEIQKGKKPVGEYRNEAIFELIQNGGMISKGELYTKIKTLLAL
jgi:hypothetical protein